MYCKKCGCKVETGDKKCRDCGTPVTEIEYCGGFWGLTESSERIKAGKAPSKDKEYEELKARVREEEKTKKKYGLCMRIISGIAAVLLIFCLIQTVRLSLLNRKIENNSDDIYKTKYEHLRRRSKDLANDYGLLNDRFEDLKDEYKEIKKEPDDEGGKSDRQSSASEKKTAQEVTSEEKESSADGEQKEVPDEDELEDNAQETETGTDITERTKSE